MPWVVVLTSRLTPAMASLRSAHGTTLTRSPTASASAWARSRVRLVMRSSGTPSSSRATTMARAAPPAPRTKAGPALPRQVGSASRRLWIYPAPSLFMPSRRPSACTTMVLMAATRRAAGCSSSMKRMAFTLCGTVTLQPAKPRADRPRMAASSRSGGTGSCT